MRKRDLSRSLYSSLIYLIRREIFCTSGIMLTWRMEAEEILKPSANQTSGRQDQTARHLICTFACSALERMPEKEVN